MLSTTARNLYWMGRYVQRAENTARVLEAAQRMALQSGSQQEAASVAAIYGLQNDFAARCPECTLPNLFEYMTLDANNPSSIFCSLRAARNDARSERNNLTTDYWENLNGLWLDVQAAQRRPRSAFDYAAFIEQVKRQTILVAGAAQSTLLRDDAFAFLAMGTFIERADNTARILDVKYHVLLPSGEPQGGSVDYYQWSEILSCIGALRTYRRVYRSRVEPLRVAELMILRHDLPRSLHFCLQQVDRYLDQLGESLGARGEAHRLAGEIHARLRYGRIDAIFRDGLHEFLTGFVAGAATLSDEIGRHFLFD
jgi:uncharacterized alpha-E superfamily protein